MWSDELHELGVPAHAILVIGDREEEVVVGFGLLYLTPYMSNEKSNKAKARMQDTENNCMA